MEIEPGVWIRAGCFLGSIAKHVLDCGEGKGEALQGLDTMDDGEGD